MSDATKPLAMGVREAAALIGISEDLLAKSDCPRVRLGRRVVYRVVDLERFLAQRVTHGLAA